MLDVYGSCVYYIIALMSCRYHIHIAICIYCEQVELRSTETLAPVEDLEAGAGKPKVGLSFIHIGKR